MTDREKVLKGLTICTKPGTKGCYYDIKECPYDEGGCRIAMMRDALELLKEREPMNVDTKVIGLPQGDIEAFCCPVCRTVLDQTFNFCPNCGQEVKWDG